MLDKNERSYLEQLLRHLSDVTCEITRIIGYNDGKKLQLDDNWSKFELVTNTEKNGGMSNASQC